MTRLHAVTRTRTSDEIQPSLASSFPSDLAPTRVIEVGEVTAGIAVPEHGGVRFFSSERIFDALDGTLFGSVEQAARAARDRSRRPVRRGQPRLVAV